MRTFRLDKLVRDGIVNDTIAQGGEVVSRKLVGSELLAALIQKIIEEAQELDAHDVSPKEIGDLQDVIEEIMRRAGISQETVDQARAKRNNTMGGFTNGDFIETLSLPDDNKWAAYYAANPNKFPEIHE